MKIEFWDGEVIELPVENEEEVKKEFRKKFEEDPARAMQELLNFVLALQSASLRVARVWSLIEPNPEDYNIGRLVPAVRKVQIGDFSFEIMTEPPEELKEILKELKED